MKKNLIQHTRFVTFLDVVILTAVISVFYFLWLGSYPVFTPDEGRYTEVAREMLASHDFITPRVNGVPFLDKPALYYWLQAASLAWFGVNEWAVRFFPACFGVSGCLMVYGFGRYLFNRLTGLLAAVILATSPLYFAGAHYANLDLEVSVFISASLLCLFAAIKDTEIKPAFLYAAYVFAGFAFLTKGMIGIVFPIMIGSIWLAVNKRWSFFLKLHLLRGAAILAVIILPWYALVQYHNPNFLHYFFIEQQFTRFLSAETFNNNSPFWFYLPIVLVGTLPWSGFFIQSLKSFKQDATMLYLTLWVGLIFVFFSLPHAKIISYILPIFPAVALMTAKLMADRFNTSRALALPCLIFTVISALFGSAILLNDHFNWFSFTPIADPYLTAVACILIFGGVIALCLTRLNMKTLFWYFTLWGVVFLLALTASAGCLNMRSTKPLIKNLQAVLQPGDEVVNYYSFYQDVPLYLGRTITLVADWHAPDIAQKDNWVRELWSQMAARQEDNLIDNQTFLSRWNSNRRVYVFLDQKYLAQFSTMVGNYHLINQYHDVILVRNQADK